MKPTPSCVPPPPAPAASSFSPYISVTYLSIANILSSSFHAVVNYIVTVVSPFSHCLGPLPFNVFQRVSNSAADACLSTDDDGTCSITNTENSLRRNSTFDMSSQSDDSSQHTTTTQPIHCPTYSDPISSRSTGDRIHTRADTYYYSPRLVDMDT